MYNCRHEIGKKLAVEILKGEYGLVMATHVDRRHVHNHFVWCVANIVTHNKYCSNKNTYHEIRNVSDRLCKEYELSVIEPQAKTYSKSYDRYRPEQTNFGTPVVLTFAIKWKPGRLDTIGLRPELNPDSRGLGTIPLPTS